MAKKKAIRGYVRRTLDKLPGVKSALVRLDDNWQEWRFPQLVQALKKWVWLWENSVALDGNPGRRDKEKDPLLHAKQEDRKRRGCVNCKSQDHNLLTVTRLNW